MKYHHKVECVLVSSINNNSFENNNRRTSFEGLTKIMSKRISNNPDYIERLSQVYVREKGSVGNLPKDLFELFKSDSKQLNKTKIAQVKEAFNEANDILSGIEEYKIENGKQMKANNIVNPFLPKLAKINIQPDRIPRIINEMRVRFTPDKAILADYAEKAGNLLSKRFREIGLLSDTDRVELSYVAQGKYKNAFKMRLIDKNENDIIHPKALLSFKSEKTSLEQVNVILSLIKNYFKDIKAKDFLRIVANILDHASQKVVPPNEKDLYKKSLLDIYSKMKTKNEEDKFMDLIKKTMSDELKYNGVGPESNLTQFIKRSAGHPMKSSDYIDVFYLNTNNNVGLSEFSDTALSAISKKINLHKYGLFHDDLITNKNNVVADRVIDYGGIKPLKGMSELSDNRVARRYYHKISQIKSKDDINTQKSRVKYWNELYDKAVNAQIANHNDILLALEKSKSLISPEYWHLLADVKTSL